MSCVRLLPIAVVVLAATTGAESSALWAQSSVGENARSATSDHGEQADSKAAGAGGSVEGLQSFALAKMFAGEGNVNDAIHHFEAAIAADSEAAFLRLEYADFLFAFNRVKRAAEQIEIARSLSPRSADVLRSYGQIRLALGRDDENAVGRAVEAFEQLREIAPADLQGMVTLGQLYQGLDRHGDAVEVFEELLRRHTDNRQLKRLLIDALQRARMTDRAQEVLEELLRLEQESIESRVALAQIESDRGNHSAAIDLLEGVPSRVDGGDQLQGFLALEYLRRSSGPGITTRQRQADLGRARELVEELSSQSALAEVHLLRAQILAEQGESDEAISILRRLRKERPNEERAVELLANVLESAGKFDQAAELVERLAKDATESEKRLSWLQTLVRIEARRENWTRVAELSENLRKQDDDQLAERAFGWQINALRQMKKYDRALSLLRKREKAQGATAALLFERADLLVDLERKDQALAVLERPELQDSTPASAFRRADLLLRLEEKAAAIEVVDRAVPADASFELQVGAGEFYLRRRHFDESVPFIERALATDVAANDSDIGADLHFYLGQAHERSGRVAEAANSFRRVLELRENDTHAMNYLGYMWAESGEHLQEALSLIERAVAIDPDNGSFVDSLGWAQYQVGRHEQARKTLERAAELTPDNATILEHLGDVYQALGEGRSARQMYKRAVELEDEENLEQVREKLQRLLELESR